MKWLYCLIIVLTLQLNILPQEGWYQQTSGTSENLNSVYFVNKDTGWAVGDDGVILKTTNGGNSWIVQYVDSLCIQKIQFLDNYTGFMGGARWGSNPRGKFLKTTDGGITWVEKQTVMYGGQSPIDIFFINHKIGWLITEGIEGFTSVMLKTIDGGETWFELISPAPGRNLQSIFFTDINNGWLALNALGPNTLFKTTDGGNNWTESLTSGYPVHLFFYNIHFVDNNTGWTVCSAYDIPNQIWSSIIYKTTNAGNEWNIQFCDTTYSELQSIQFTDANYGWACGDYGAILHTTNGGNVWIVQESGTAENLKELFFMDNSTGWAVGKGGTILKTTTGGVVYVEEQEIDEIPTAYQLSNNFPNPFNPSTKIRYSIPQSSNVVIKVFDILGNEIVTLVNEEKHIGNYEVEFSVGQNSILSRSSGIYFYQIRTGSFVETKKMILLK